MLNFDGLGLAFEVDDQGSASKVKSLSDSVGDLWDGLKKAGDGVAAVSRSIGRGFGRIGDVGRRGFGAAAIALGQMVDKALSPELDHAYSSMYQQFNKTFSAATVGMQLTSAEAKKMQRVVGGVAFGMGEDMDAAAKSFLAFEKQGINLERVLGKKGLASTSKSLIKITSVFGIEGEQLAMITSGLIKSFNFTEEAVGKLGDKIFVIGKKFNIGAEAIQAWPSIMESVNKATADFGRQLTPEEIEKLTLSIYKLGAGFKESLGLGGAQAIELARSVFDTLSSERKNILDMVRGMGSEFGDVSSMLLETGGDVDKVFKTLAEGDPLRFMDMIRQMAVVAEKRGGKTGAAFQRLSKVIDQSLGPDVTFAMKGSWDSVKKKLGEVPAEIDKSKGALAGAAEAHYRTSITAGEAWDRMINGMKARLFSLSQKDVNRWQKDMKVGFEKTFGVIKKLASDKGPLGELTRRLLAVERVGLSALAPGLASLSPLIGGVATSMMPVMTALGSMGLRFGDLGKMALSGGALWVVFKLLKDGPEQTIKNLKKFKDDFLKSFQEMFPEAYVSVEKFWDDMKSGKFVEGIKEELSKIDFGSIFGDILGFAEKALSGLGNILSRAIDAIDFRSITRNVIGFVGKIAGGLLEGVLSAVSGEDAKTKIERSISGLGRSIIGGVGEILLGAVDAVFEMLSKIDVGRVASQIGSAVSNIGTTVMDYITRTLETTDWRAIGSKVSMFFVSVFKTAIESIKGVVSGVIDIYVSLLSGKKSESKLVNSIVEMVKGAFHAMAGFLIGAFEGMFREEILRTKIFVNMVVQYFWAGVSSIKTMFFGLKDAVGGVWNWISSGAESLVYRVQSFFVDMKFGILEKITTMKNEIAEVFSGLTSKLFYPFALLSFQVKGWIADFVDMIFSKLKNIPGFEKIVGKDVIQGAEKFSKDLRKQQKEELGGEKTFGAAYEKRQKDQLLAITESGKTSLAGLRAEQERQKKFFDDAAAAASAEAKAELGKARASVDLAMRDVGGKFIDASAQIVKDTGAAVDAYNAMRQQETTPVIAGVGGLGGYEKKEVVSKARPIKGRRGEKIVVRPEKGAAGKEKISVASIATEKEYGAAIASEKGGTGKGVLSRDDLELMAGAFGKGMAETMAKSGMSANVVTNVNIDGKKVASAVKRNERLDFSPAMAR